MGYDQDKNALIERYPAEDAVLAERPMAAQRGFDVSEVTALAKTHLLHESC